MSSESLSRAYELTRTLVAAVEAGDWQFASDLADERSPLIMALEATQTDEALATIRAIQAMDATITLQARDIHEAMANEFNHANQKISAASFYQSTGQLR
ncbi:flagellar protein FliT [Trinickia sp. LjRoot230]|uniref:flagellar protein FliT n=1 Tax=Trinickia sp. LjRoot230 TaxID=3342288 RepID=UPI003ECC48DE